MTKEINNLARQIPDNCGKFRNPHATTLQYKVWTLRTEKGREARNDSSPFEYFPSISQQSPFIWP